MQALLHIPPRHQCDAHIVKLPTEIAQIGCYVAGRLGLTDRPGFWDGFPRATPYKVGGSHRNHPLTVWAASSCWAYLSLMEHGLAQCREHWHRYRAPKRIPGPRHGAWAVLEWLADHGAILDALPDREPTAYPVAPLVAVPGDPVAGERRLCVAKFRGDVDGIDRINMTWTRREMPGWMREAA